MAVKQLPPVRLDPEALAIIKKYQDQIAETTVGYLRVFPSDAVKHMDRLIDKQDDKQEPINSIEREVKWSGNKAQINMPKEWAGKKVKVIEVKE